MSGGRLLHVELQSTNDRAMPFRMAEYALAITRRYSQYPIQLVLYVGNARLRMKSEFRTDGMVCQYRLADVRSLDASSLLASDRIEDNILAVLVGLDDSVEGIHSILTRIAKLKKPLREPMWRQLLLTCGIRGLATVAEKELRTMPIASDILDKDPLFASYIEKGRRKGLEKGRQEGQIEGIREVVRLQVEKRFGRLPASVTRRLAKLSDAKAKELALAIIDAKSLKELFGSSR
jgi:predicted transposase YdaD